MKVKFTKYDLIVVIGLVLLVAIDLTTKTIFEGSFGLYNLVTAIPYLFNIFCIHNTGASYGIFQNSRWLLVCVTLLFIIVFIVYYVLNKNKNPLFYISSALLMAGAIGNLMDRLIFGYVRDFIQFAFWTKFPVFNFADVFITFGVIIFAIYILFPNAFKKKPKKFVINVELPQDDDKEKGEK